MAGKLTLTVSQLNEYIRRTLQLDPVLRHVELRGEISNLKFHQTGMLFFSLRDEQAAISCVMYAADVERLQCEPFDGMRVVVTGSVSLYVRGGQMQFCANELHPQGVGVLYERLMAVKAKLSAEGLLDPAGKRPIPAYPDTIGVATSPTGAVIHDILNVSLRRDPQARILLCPTRVQGIGAADEVARAIRTLDSMESVSVIIVARGGGSMEDLWTFQEETVVRAVAACKKPVVSAVGHETDVTLCDLAADLRAPTPSAAAECVVPLRSETTARLDALRDALDSGAAAQLERRQAALGLLRERLAAMQPARRLEQEAQRLCQLRMEMRKSMLRALSQRGERLTQRRRELELLSPYGVLARGYAMVIRGGVPVASRGQLVAGDCVTIRFADGDVRAAIEDGAQEETS